MFIDNGLEVDDELKRFYSDYRLAEILKSEFDLSIRGLSRSSDPELSRFAKEVQRVYESLVDPNK